MEPSIIGRQLRALRTASGRTVASVAADAGLSVPYIANLENGRGNPTTAALTRLASALGMRLVVAMVPADDDDKGDTAAAPEVPSGLVRLGRTERFRQAAAAIGAAHGADSDEQAADLVTALARLAQSLNGELSEADWWRLLDALVLVAAHPAASGH